MPKRCVYKKEYEKDNKLYFIDNEDEKEKEFKINKFRTGFTCGGKLTFKHVKGGVKLIETEFTIKEEKLFKKH